MSRNIKPCNCAYNRDENWGYIVFEWVGHPKYWRRVNRNRSKIKTAEKQASKYKHVLISCAGCGKDVVREYGPEKQKD